jgi:glycosyltransferase involved in cell wall biosynthesis
MKIAIDARTYFWSNGQGRFTRGLVNSLVANFPEDEYIVFFSQQRSLSDLPLRAANLAAKTSGADLYNIDEEEAILVKELDDARADLIFFPKPVTWGRFNAPVVTTIHDLYFAHSPQYLGADKVQYYLMCIDSALQESKGIIAVSNYVKSDIITYAVTTGLNLDEDKIYVIYYGADDIFFKKSSDIHASTILRKHELTERGYLLFVGPIVPRKNAERLLTTYDHLYNDIKIPLVIVGSIGLGTEGFRKTLEKIKNKKQVRLLGFVKDEELTVLYQSTTALVFPSLSEGFGIQVAEAYASGIPVITSNTTSLKEIGKAALQIDPLSPGELGEAIIRVVKDNNLRIRLIKSGAEQARKYSWTATSVKIRQLFRLITGK